MPVKLSAIIKKIEDISNITNRTLLTDFHKYLKSNGVSDSHQKNNLKRSNDLRTLLGPNIGFLDIKENDPIISFLDSKLKDIESDPDRTSLVTWNDLLGRIKYFIRWLYNCRIRDSKEIGLLVDPAYWDPRNNVQFYVTLMQSFVNSTFIST